MRSVLSVSAAMLIRFLSEGLDAAGLHAASMLHAFSHILATPDWWLAICAGLSLIILALTFYAERVFVRQHLTATVYGSGFQNEQLRTQMIVTNGGNRDLTLLDVRAQYKLAGGPLGDDRGAALAPRLVEGLSDIFPIVLKAGETRNIAVAQDYDVALAFEDKHQGRTLAPDLKRIEYSLMFTFVDCYGEMLLTTVPSGQQNVGPGGSLKGGGHVIRLQVLNRRRWFGTFR